MLQNDSPTRARKKPIGMTETQTYFEPADPVSWARMVDKVLKGAPLDSLTRHDEDNLPTDAFYPVREDVAARGPLLPSVPSKRVTHGWDICQPMAEGSRNADILDALASGATALTLAGAMAEGIAGLLDQVVLSAITLGFEAPDDPQALYTAVLRCAAEGEIAPDKLTIDLGIDPFAARAPADGLVSGCALASKAISRAAPHHYVMRLDGWTRHNQGLTAAQELGFILAGIAEILRAGAARGIDPAQMAGRVSARVALPPDTFAGIIKCRALRVLWDGILSACGVDAAARPPLRLQGYGGLRMMTVLDSEVNMLRTTTALLGGAIGGADSLAGFGHDVLTGESPAAARLVRMTQAMMIAESQLSTSLDPVAGAPFLETRTDALAAAGWTAFQEIEREGGLCAALANGMIAAQADSAAEHRETALRCGKADLVGVTLQPRAETVPVALSAFDTVRRPAAPVEQLRQAAAAKAPRILLLRGDDDGAAGAERTVRRWLQIAGLQALSLPGADGAAIATARPDCVFLCGDVGTEITDALDPGVTILTAAELAAADDKITLLGSLLLQGDDG